MKKKAHEGFPICYRGYDKEAVNGYIALAEAKADELQLEQRERINALKDENARLLDELAALKNREEQIKLALVTATDNARKLNEDVRLRYERELERLRLFRAKWINVYEQLKERYHFDKDALNVESVAVSIELELKRMLAKDFSLDKAPVENEMEAHYRREVERLTQKQINCQNKAVERDATVVATSLAAGSSGKMPPRGGKSARDDVAFSLDEALNPQTAIRETCQALELAK